jgi:hypothetical protein
LYCLNVHVVFLKHVEVTVMGERWDHFMAKLKMGGDGELEKFEVKKEELRKLRKRIKFRAFNDSSVSKMAAVEMGWSPDDRGLVLEDLEALKLAEVEELEKVRVEREKLDSGRAVVGLSPWARAKVQPVQESQAVLNIDVMKGVPPVDRVVKADAAPVVQEPVADWPEKQKRRGRLPKVAAEPAPGLARDLVELARLVGDRSAPASVCVDWVLEHALLPLEQIEAGSVPGAGCVLLLEMCQTAGGRAKLLQWKYSRLMSQEETEWEKIRADMGKNVREELMAFTVPILVEPAIPFCPEGVGVRGVGGASEAAECVEVGNGVEGGGVSVVG